MIGLWIRPAAAIALFLVLNFHFGTSALYAWEFLRDGTGPPILAALVALVIGATTCLLRSVNGGSDVGCRAWTADAERWPTSQ